MPITDLHLKENFLLSTEKLSEKILINFPQIKRVFFHGDFSKLGTKRIRIESAMAVDRDEILKFIKNQTSEPVKNIENKRIQEVEIMTNDQMSETKKTKRAAWLEMMQEEMLEQESKSQAAIDRANSVVEVARAKVDQMVADAIKAVKDESEKILQDARRLSQNAEKRININLATVEKRINDGLAATKNEIKNELTTIKEEIRGVAENFDTLAHNFSRHQANFRAGARIMLQEDKQDQGK